MVRDVAQAAGVAGGSGTGPGTEARDAKTTCECMLCQACAIPNTQTCAVLK